jgi:hypothetical protein
MKTLAFLLINLIANFILFSTAAADIIDGNIISFNYKNGIKLISNGKKYNFSFQNTEIQNQIDKLKLTDFISLEGIINEESQSILVTSLNYVGLSALIGRWSGNDSLCYFFKNYSDLLVYSKTTQVGSKRSKCTYKEPELVHKLTYTINPTSLNWLILLSDNDNSYLVDLLIKSTNMIELTVYDNEKGDILKKIKLRH